MLKELYIENYKSLKNVTVQFKDGLNIIIGKNGSGKSNLLEFINKVIGISVFFSKQGLYDGRLPEENFQYAFHYYDESRKDVELILKLYSEYDKRNEFNNNRRLIVAWDIEKKIFISQKFENESIPFFAETFSDDSNSTLNKKSIGIFGGIDLSFRNNFSRIFSTLQKIDGLTTLYLKFNTPEKTPWLDNANVFSIGINGILFNQNESDYFLLLAFGFQNFLQEKIIRNAIDFLDENITTLIKNLINNGFEEYKKNVLIDEALTYYSPVQNIRLSSNVNVYQINDTISVENLTLEFLIDGNWIPWSYLSDGTKRLFYLISEISMCKSGVILIEEPELGIHPHQLFLLMKFIKEQAADKQIIISTHSSIALDVLNSNELDRITIAKSENGSSKFTKLTEEQTTHAKQYMEEVAELSYYWLHSDLEDND